MPYTCTYKNTSKVEAWYVRLNYMIEVFHMALSMLQTHGRTLTYTGLRFSGYEQVPIIG